ncbi:hypothetical protein DY000_02012978 [Brassica cretica]|uniref:Uncharacterized protein n=1 Tax=Brassica cretica TaxID=69181 RepID=A0ABQ7D8Z9_BRACR|nr:hypothetical protein DY000_02012978 [Brassica cretica]
MRSLPGKPEENPKESCNVVFSTTSPEIELSDHEKEEDEIERLIFGTEFGEVERVVVAIAEAQIVKDAARKLEGDTVDKDPGCVKGNDDMHKQRKKMRRSEGAVVVLEMDGTSLTVIDVWSDGDMFATVFGRQHRKVDENAWIRVVSTFRKSSVAEELGRYVATERNARSFAT